MSVSMDVEPSRVTFNDVHTNQTYTTTLTVSNPLDNQVQFDVVASTSRITVSPPSVTLRAGQSVVLTIRLTLSHYPKVLTGHIQLKGTFFNQIIPVDIQLSSLIPSHIKPAASSSPSPSSRSIASNIRKERRDVAQSEGAAIRELSDTNKSLRKQNESLEHMVKMLKIENPQFKDVLPMYEEYEERCKTAMKLLRDKDGTIEQLKLELSEANHKIQELRDLEAKENRETILKQGKHRNYYSGRVDEEGIAEELDRMRLQMENEQLKKQLAAAKESAPTEEVAHHRQELQHQHEVKHLRERITEYIEDRKVLQREFVDVKSELDKVKAELESTKHERDQFKSLNGQIRRSHEELQQKLLLAEQQTLRLQKDNETLVQQRKQSSRVSFDRTRDDLADVQFEPEVGGPPGALRTVTPTYYGLHNKENIVQTLNEKDNRAQQLQESLEKYMRELEISKSRLMESSSIESALRERIAELEKRLSVTDHENRVMFERVERLKSVQEETEFALQDKEVQLQAALDKAVEKAGTNSVNDAHVWWSYVWHETRKAAQQNKVVPGDFNFNPYAASAANNGGSGVAADVTVNVHLQKMKDNIRDHVIEIENLRQQLLGHQLSSKKEMDNLRSQLEVSRREVVRLNAQARIHRGDKDVQIAQRDARIRVLSSNTTDVHTKLNDALVELETEKLSNHHLRADIDSYRSMIEEEQRKLQLTRKDMASLQQTIDSMAVYQTVMNIPGVEPSMVIEMMSGQLNQLRSDLSKTKQALSETTAQVKSLQHAASLSGQRAAAKSVQNTPNVGVAGPSAGTPAPGSADRRSRSSRSLSPSSRSQTGRSASGSLNSITATYDRLLRTPKLSLLKPNRRSSTPLDDTILDDDDLEGVMHQSSLASPNRQSFDPTLDLHVQVNSETTPDALLDKLDSSMLIQRIHTQESTIAELRARVEDLTENGLSTTKELMLERDVADYGDRLELDAALRRYELLQTQHDEAKQELATLRERLIGLEKALVDKNIDDFMVRINGSAVIAPTPDRGVVDDELPLLGKNGSDLSTVVSAGDDAVTADILSKGDASAMLDEVMKQLASKDSQLKEKSTQLKVVRETLDSLQTAGVGAFDTPSDENVLDEDAYLFAPKSTQRRSAAARSAHVSNAYDSMGLADLASMPGLSPTNGGAAGRTNETSAGVQALITRVVQLTSELSVQCSATAVQERTVADLEHANRKKSKDLNRYKATVKTLDEQLSAARLSLISLTTQLKEQEKQYLENTTGLRRENDELSCALREAECSLSNYELRVHELSEQVKVVDHQDFQSWLEAISLDNQRILTTPYEIKPVEGAASLPASDDAAKNTSEESEYFLGRKINEYSVRELVESLIGRWKAYVGNEPVSAAHANSGSTPRVSKAEQRFLQRVADLVLNANDRASEASATMAQALDQAKRYELLSRITNERLHVCAQHLNRYRKRCLAYESVINSDMKANVAKQTKLEAHLRKSLAKERSTLSECIESLRTEHRDRQIVEIKRQLEGNQIHKMQAQLAEYESRGSATLRGRDEAIASLEAKLKNAHDSMIRWFKNELPRLVCGLPITEHSVSSIFAESNIMGGYGLDGAQTSVDAVFSQHEGDVTKQLLANLGLDRTYSLSQALVVSQAAQANQNMRITGLNEKLAIYKERNLELEGVIMRWKEQINQSLREQRLHSSAQEAAQAHYLGDSGMLRLSSDNTVSNLDAMIQRVYHNSDVEKNLTAQITLLNNRLVEVEEECIEAKGKFQHANARASELKTLVDTVLADEQVLKSKATQQLTKLRVDLENEHAQELRRQRHTAEADKRALIAELEKVSHAVEEAHLETVDPFAWQRLIKGTRQGGDIHISSGHPAENSGSYEPLFFDSLREDSPRSVEKEEPKQTRKSSDRHKKKSSKSRKHRDDGSSHISSSSDGKSSGSSGSSSSSDDSDQDELARIGETNHRQIRSDKPEARRKTSGKKSSDGKKHRKGRNGEVGSATSSLSSHTDNRDGKHLKDIQVENLTRVLEIERRKTTEARHELEELEHIVSVQNSMLKMQQDKEQSMLNNTLMNTTASTDPQPTAGQPLPKEEFAAENEVRKEDQSLWPSLGSLADELMVLLQTLSQKSAGSTVADMARSALSMAARVKVACTTPSTDTLSQRPTNRPTHTNSATTVTGAHTSEGHHFFDQVEDQSRRRNLPEDTRSSSSAYANETRVGAGVDVTGHFKTLASRVKMIESDLLNDNIPERHLYLLRDLRMRVGEIETAMREEMDQQRAAWSEERASLLRVAQENMALVDQLRQEQEGNVSVIRGRYEEALAHSQEALEQNTAVARMEIQRLEDELMRLQAVISSGGGSSHYEHQQQTHRGRTSSAHQVQNNRDLENAKHQIETMVTQHKSEINQLKTHFSKYQRAQGEIVRCLEDQLEEMQHGSFLSGVSPFDNMTEVNSIEEAADKIRRLEFKNRTKTMEMEAVMRALSKTIDGEYSTAEGGEQYQQQFPSQYRSSSHDHHEGHYDANDDTYSTIEMPELLVKPMKPPSHPYDRPAGSEGIAMQRTGAGNASSQPSQHSRRGSINAGGGAAASAAPVTAPSNTGITEVKEEIYEARLLAAETEIEALHKNLLKERTTSQGLRTAMQKLLEKRGEEMKEQQERVASKPATAGLSQQQSSGPVEVSTGAPNAAGEVSQQAAAGLQNNAAAPLSVERNSDRFIVNDAFLTDYAQEFSLPADGPSFKEKVRQTIRRANTFRQSARVEVSRMKDHILHQENNLTQLREEILKQRAATVEAKNTLVSLRDDNSRKTKLLHALKVAKTADSNSLEQWKTEAKENEENVKRLQRAIQSKDALIKDLKAKIETLEEAAAHAAEHRPQSTFGAAPAATAGASTIVDQSGLTVDIGSLSLFELRTKLKASELERNRSRTRIQALKERVVELEGELKPLQQEVDRLRKVNERSEGLKTALTRKEQQMTQLRSQLDRATIKESELRQAIAESGEEAEQRIKALQRQIDSSLIESANRDRETDLLRQRVYSLQGEKNAEAGARIAEAVDHQIHAGAAASTTNNQFAQLYSQPQVQPTSHRPNLVLPSSLGVAASHDLQDVISALGGNIPATTAAAPRPRSAATGAVNSSTLSSSSSSSSDVSRNVTQRLSFPPMGGASSSALPDSSTSMSSVDESGAGGGALGGVSSVEKRLKALVSSALNSPTRRK